MMKICIILLLGILSFGSVTQSYAAPIPERFDSVGEDRVAIEKLLSEYTAAVSTKDQSRFEALLLNKDIPFSDANSAVAAKGADHSTQNYESFRKGVFEGPAFQQRFQDVKILQKGALAQVSLVFVNTTSTESGSGWKTMELLKIDGRWKIASEFFIGLD